MVVVVVVVVCICVCVCVCVCTCVGGACVVRACVRVTKGGLSRLFISDTGVNDAFTHSLVPQIPKMNSGNKKLNIWTHFDNNNNEL